MNCISRNWGLLSTRGLKDRIHPNPIYQRGEVWNLRQRQLLIDSILKGIELPKFYLRRLENSDKYSFEVIDGQQRLKAIWGFLDDEFKLSKKMDDILYNGKQYKVKDKKYTEIDITLRTEIIDIFNINLVTIENADEEAIGDLFFRLNNGTPLNQPEKRNCLPGKMTEFIREIAKHRFFEKCGFNNVRMTFDQISAQIVCLELNGGVSYIGNSALEIMYKNLKENVPEKIIHKVKANLNLLDSIFAVKNPYLIKTVVINMYLLVSYLSQHTNLRLISKNILDWFNNSELKRSKKNKDYRYAMDKSVTQRESIKTRIEIVLLDFFKSQQEINFINLDENRIFTDDQRREIFMRDGGRCKECGRQLNFDKDWHADHKTPWIKGGKTTVDNGQVLCRKHNLEKSDKIKFI